jgi:hypothetical protein
MTDDARRRGPLDGQALALFWGSALAGVLLPPLSAWVATGQSASEVCSDYWLSFTGAEPGLAYMTALHAAPFVAFGVFSLLHLGIAPAADSSLAARRLGGALTAALLMILVSLWGNTALFSSRSSTAGLGFMVLPFYVLLASAFGYGLGRLLPRFTRRG